LLLSGDCHALITAITPKACLDERQRTDVRHAPPWRILIAALFLDSIVGLISLRILTDAKDSIEEDVREVVELYMTMLENMDDCFLNTYIWEKVRKRMKPVR